MIVLLVFLGSNSGQTVADEKSQSFDSSEVVLVGKIVSTAWIADADKMGYKTGKRLPWDPKEYVLGTEAVMEISQVLKDQTKSKGLKTIRILVPTPHCRHGLPCFVAGKEYLVFLNKAKLDKEYKNAIALRSKKAFDAPENRFDPRAYFFVNGGEWGSIGDKKKIYDFLDTWKRKQ